MSSPARALNKSQPRPLQVLIPLFTDFNTFDANGPIEVLSQGIRQSGPNDTPPFKLTVTAATELTRSIEGVRMARDISLIDAIKRIDEWDIVLLPGGVAGTILEIINLHLESDPSKRKHSELLQFLDEYVTDPSRLILTICTGSLFLGALGRLKGRTATSHWASLAALNKLCTALGSTESTKTEIVRARWVDSDPSNEAGLKGPRIITAGGVSCGVDATFYLLEMIVGPEIAEKAAKNLDYQRRGEERQSV